eukprot:15003486-Alexandrium_andersonii.AAC.1
MSALCRRPAGVASTRAARILPGPFAAPPTTTRTGPLRTCSGKGSSTLLLTPTWRWLAKQTHPSIERVPQWVGAR